ncbi:PREDICTED: VQ motif-containing protein 17-like [Lupinus angustifolius]|uniref:VQ motif-containing protein 17-like n=1 Tax=Lupinus angustifolius TaxID=3871 RepID=UPI00092F4B1F|nr:PREDICTED: VQ motif-containing protein 17-like [Lupinus angustifolius]
MTKLQTCYPKSATSSKVGIERDSHVISKFKPKIRIIHIYAPEIIKTDAANFRELVQRLTGKPEDKGRDGSKSKTIPTKYPMDLNPNKGMNMIMEEEEEGGGEEFMNLQNGIRVKDQKEDQEVENDIWRRSKSIEKLSSFFDGFSELESFMEELSTKPIVY